MLFVSKASFYSSLFGRQLGCSLSLVLQVASESAGQGEVGKKVESVTADTVPDALTTQLAQQSWCSCGKETTKNYLGRL